ncbi:MAG TPA: hypothetical protein ENO10_02785 [Salinimicrobium catena]|uniref:Uncharacterized protein n=1 Tax=Salinimicrobium catena TaxID=390640 RepID=A0A7C2M1Q1_9FLAO|nr:hypothetical protein [Salinimicrobium catena]
MSISEKYSNGGVAYVLKKTAMGYELFKKGQTETFARLIKSGSGNNFLYSTGSVSGNAYFDAEGNLIAEYVDPNSGQVISVIYRKDQ